jgi:hypothetical protein
MALAMYTIQRGGGFTTGGLNFDAKVRRPSIDAVDMFHGHVGAMDLCARALLAAEQMIVDGGHTRFLADRYAGWRGPIGERWLAQAYAAGRRGARAQAQCRRRPVSGQQERLRTGSTVSAVDTQASMGAPGDPLAAYVVGSFDTKGARARLRRRASATGRGRVTVMSRRDTARAARCPNAEVAAAPSGGVRAVFSGSAAAQSETTARALVAFLASRGGGVIGAAAPGCRAALAGASGVRWAAPSCSCARSPRATCAPSSAAPTS